MDEVGYFTARRIQYFVAVFRSPLFFSTSLGCTRIAANTTNYRATPNRESRKTNAFFEIDHALGFDFWRRAHAYYPNGAIYAIDLLPLFLLNHAVS